MRVRQTELPGVVVIEPAVHRDERGFFLETYHADKYRAAGLTLPFVQDNHSRSAPGILRGLHAQLGAPLGKLVRCVRGAIFDVAVDVRRGSPHFRRWVGVTLSEDTCHQLWVPPGFLHGFCVVAGPAEVEYKCTALWDPTQEIAVRWNDPQLAIAWPIATPRLSDKDAAAPLLEAVYDRLPEYEA
ncbi:dTDP-4-dehydrorhamnose 3,5-epimerase [bacterium]|nr:dTDP-4-dehydrorhamnose 3,5-epimerase [bacterium]